MWPKSQDVEQKQHCNEFSEDFKGGPHHNIVKKKKKKDGRRKWVKVQRKEKLKKYPWITLDIV